MHMDTGDHVVIVNASKIVLTKGKADKELVHDYSGYPGGLALTDLRHLARGVSRKMQFVAPFAACCLKDLLVVR